MPFDARGKGFAGSVTRIISLNNRAKVGAILFASSTIGLKTKPLISDEPSGESRQHPPDLVSELNESSRVAGVHRILCARLYENSTFVLSTTEHHDSGHHGVRPYQAFLWNRHDFLTGAEHYDVVLPTSALGET